MEAGQRAPLTILIIDDNERLLSSYETYFQQEGFTVFSAIEGKSGLELAKKQHPKIIILDLMLPGMDGLKVLHELKKDRSVKDIPVIVLTALVNELEKEESLRAGAIDYIEKIDIEPDQLLKRIQEILKEN